MARRHHKTTHTITKPGRFNYNRLVWRLHEGAKKGQYQVVKYFVGQMDANTRDPITKYTPLHQASIYGHVKIVECLLEYGAEINAPTPTDANCTSLHLAATFGHHEVVKVLLQHGAIVNFTPMIQKQTPLHLAAINGHEKVAEVLLKHSKVKPNDRDENDLTPLHWAAAYGHINVVKQLLLNGANVNMKNNSSWSPLGGKYNFHEMKQCTPLHLAANNGHFDVILILISFGAELNARNGFNWTPLHQSSRNGFQEIVKCLITFGATMDQDLFWARDENCLPLLMKMWSELQKNNCLSYDFVYLDSLFSQRNKLIFS